MTIEGVTFTVEPESDGLFYCSAKRGAEELLDAWSPTNAADALGRAVGEALARGMLAVAQ